MLQIALQLCQYLSVRPCLVNILQIFSPLLDRLLSFDVSVRLKNLLSQVQGFSQKRLFRQLEMVDLLLTDVDICRIFEVLAADTVRLVNRDFLERSGFVDKGASGSVEEGEIGLGDKGAGLLGEDVGKGDQFET